MHFFLKLDNRLRLLQATLEHAILMLEPLRLRIHSLSLSASLLRGETLLPLPAPGREQGGIQAFLPQQCPQLARPGARVGFAEDLKLVLGREAGRVNARETA